MDDHWDKPKHAGCEFHYPVFGPYLLYVYYPHRSNSLEEKIKALKKKESEDAKTLEAIVQKVESNLTTTTVSPTEVLFI